MSDDGAFADDITEFYRALSPEQVMGGITKAVKAHDFDPAELTLPDERWFQPAVSA